jgi:hypothetical protein
MTSEIQKMRIELKATQEALASSWETNQALSKKLLSVKLAGCSALKWMYSEIKAKKDDNENNYNPFVGLYDLLYGDKQ